MFSRKAIIWRFHVMVILLRPSWGFKFTVALSRKGSTVALSRTGCTLRFSQKVIFWRFSRKSDTVVVFTKGLYCCAFHERVIIQWLFSRKDDTLRFLESPTWLRFFTGEFNTSTPTPFNTTHPLAYLYFLIFAPI